MSHLLVRSPNGLSAKAEPVTYQKLEARSVFHVECNGSSSSAFLVHKQGAGCDVENLGLEPVLIRDAGVITGRGLECWPTALTPGSGYLTPLF